MFLDGELEVPLASLGEARAIAWSDATMYGIRWADDGIDLFFDLKLGSVDRRLGTDTVTLRATWACGLDIDMQWKPVGEMPRGGPAMTWDVTFARDDATWRVEFDFCSEGSIRFQCNELFVRVRTPSNRKR